MILSGLDFIKVVREAGEEVHCICPFHNDHRASLSVNPEKKKWNCFACGKGGNIPELKMTYYSKIYHGELLKNETVLKVLNQRLLTPALIKKWSLGILNKDRISIPYFRGNDIVYGMKYHYIGKSKEEDKVIIEGGVPDFFPNWDFDIQNEKVFLTEGEFDSILAREIFGRSVGTFGSVTSFEKKYLKWFKGKIVTLILDNDKPGKQGADRLTSKIQTVAKEVRRCLLKDKQEKDVKDINDFLIKFSEADLKKIVNNSPIYKIEGDTHVIEIRADWNSEMSEEILFENSLRSSHFGKLMTVSGLVAGKDNSPFLIPVQAALYCTSSRKSKSCSACSLKEDTIELRINPLSKNIVQLMLTPDNQQRHLLRTLVNLPRCPEIEIKNLKMMSMEELKIVPKSAADRYTGYSSRQVFYVSDKFVDTNSAYTFRGILLPEPRLQYTIILSDRAVKDKHDLELFSITKEGIKELRNNVKEAEGFKGLGNIVEGITGIYYRKSMLSVMLLTFLSVLKFQMFGKTHRGYISSLIVGDTRTGKSDSIERLTGALKLGEIMSGKIASRAGIIGGVKQIGMRWKVNWGKLVINNGGFLAIDEAHGISVDIFSRLSNTRSKGIAEITQIETENMKAETRLLVIANPRSNKSMKDFGYGVEAVKDLVGKAEDVARFDLFCGTLIDSIEKTKLMDAMEKGPVFSEADVEMIRKLVMFIWTRKEDQINFSKETISKLKEMAGSFNYSPEIPLIEQNEAVYKLARISIAFASGNGNLNTEGSIEVKPSDVTEASYFLKECYEDPALNYGEFSLTFSSKGIKDLRAVTEKIKYLGPEFVEGLLSSSQLTLMDISDYSGLSDRAEAQELKSHLVRNRALVKKYSYYEKSPDFIKLLKEIFSEMNGGKNGKSK